MWLSPGGVRAAPAPSCPPGSKDLSVQSEPGSDPAAEVRRATAWGGDMFNFCFVCIYLSLPDKNISRQCGIVHRSIPEGLIFTSLTVLGISVC